MSYPRRTPYVHIEAIGDELCVYDWQRRRVHALNPTAALVWQRCDGATPLEAIAEAVRLCLGAADSRALVSATLRELANADLLVESGEVAGPDATRRALLQRGIAAALLPVVHSIVAPEPLAAQSLGAPTLTGIAPGIGARSVTVRVTLTGTNFAVGNTTVAVSGSGVTVANVNVVSPTSLTADFAISGAAVVGARLFTIATPAGSADGVFTVVPFVTTFSFIPGGPQSFTVPAAVTSLTIAASGGEGGPAGADGISGGLGGSITATIDVTPGETLAIFVGGAGVPATDTRSVFGGFNGGGIGPPSGGSGGGASDVRRGGVLLTDRVIVAAGGGGAGAAGGDGVGARLGFGIAGGAGGGTTGGSGGNSAGATGGAGGTQSAGGVGGGGADVGESGFSGTGGRGAFILPTGSGSGGGGGGGLFGGGGGGAGGGGGGGSSAAAVSARNVTTTPGTRAGHGQVIISF